MMENPRPEKVAVVDEVREKLAGADAALLTEYRGLTVKQLAELRRALRPAGGEYKVYKNTLVRFAAREVAEDRLDSMLTGPTAITFVQGDPAAVAKALRDYAKGHPALVLKGGLLGDKIVTGKDVEALADLPSRDVLLGPTGRHASGTLVKLASLLQALPRNFAYGLTGHARRAERRSRAGREPHHRRTGSGVRARGRGRASGGSHPGIREPRKRSNHHANPHQGRDPRGDLGLTRARGV